MRKLSNKHTAGQVEFALGLADVRAARVVRVDVRKPVSYSDWLAFFSPLSVSWVRCNAGIGGVR